MSQADKLYLGWCGGTEDILSQAVFSSLKILLNSKTWTPPSATFDASVLAKAIGDVFNTRGTVEFVCRDKSVFKLMGVGNGMAKALVPQAAN